LLRKLNAKTQFQKYWFNLGIELSYISIRMISTTATPTTSTSPLPVVSSIDSDGERYIKIAIGVAIAVLVLGAGGIYWVIRRRWRGVGQGEMGGGVEIGEIRDVGGLWGGSGNESLRTRRGGGGEAGGKDKDNGKKVDNVGDLGG
jgi:hypothetical protein